MAHTPTIRIVTLGKTGSGKSSFSNTLFEENAFPVNPSANSETKICKSKTKTINGVNIQLVDTPGFFDTDQNSDVSEELLECIVECAPGPHAFLLVLKIEKFTSLEQAIVDLMLEYFSEEALKFTTVVFTHGDDLPEDMTIEDWVKENKALNELVEKCGGRCHVIDNKYWKNSTDEYRNNQNQIKNLLQTIDNIMQESDGNYYTNDRLQEVQMMRQEERALIQQDLPDIPEELLHQRVNESLIARLRENWIGVTMGMAICVLVGGVVMGRRQLSAIRV